MSHPSTRWQRTHAQQQDHDKARVRVDNTITADNLAPTLHLTRAHLDKLVATGRVEIPGLNIVVGS